MSGDYTKKVRGEMRLSERIASYIPGYRGYKEKEIRRETDRLVRMNVAGALRGAKDSIRRSTSNPSVLQKLTDEDRWRLDTVLSKLDRITQRIDRAIAGYAGMFDAIKVKEDKLDAIIASDLKLIETGQDIRASADKTNKMDIGGDEWKSSMEALSSKLDDFDTLMDERINTIKGISEQIPPAP